MKTKIILLILILFLMTGCWDYNELNKLAIITGIAIDKYDDKLEVSILISNSKKATSINSGNSNTLIYTKKGDTLPEALKEIALTSPKKLYLGHLSAIIISEDVAKDGLSNISDYLLREKEVIKSFYLVLAKDVKAKEILNILSPLEAFPSETIYKNITTSSDSEAFSLAVSYNDFIKNMLATGKNPILPSITLIKNEEENSELKIDNIGIFKNDKLLGYASSDASRGISIIENAVNQMTSTIKCNNGKVSLNINSLKSKKNIKNDKIIINVKGSAILKDVNCSLDLNNTNSIKKLEKDIEQNLKKLITKAINETQNYKSDVFGFGNILYKNDFNYYKNIKNKWNETIYPSLNYEINVDIKLISNGSINQTIKEVISEKKV